MARAGAILRARAGALVLLCLLFFLLTGRISEAGMVPAVPIAELAILLGIVAFTVNLFLRAR